MPLTRPGFWCDPEFTNTRLLADLARARPEATIPVLRNRNITGNELIELARTAHWTGTNVDDAGPHGLLQHRTAEDQYQLIIHAAKRSAAAAKELLPYANTACLARLRTAIENREPGTGRIAAAWALLGYAFHRLVRESDHPQYLNVLRSISPHVPHTLLGDFIMAFIAGARTAEDDAEVGQLMGQHSRIDWRVHDFVTRLVLWTWDEPEELLRWCTASDIGALAIQAHPKLPSNNLSVPAPPLGAAPLPEPPRFGTEEPLDRDALHARLEEVIDTANPEDLSDFAADLAAQVLGASAGLNVLELLDEMTNGGSGWPHLRAAALIDGNSINEAEKILLARGFEEDNFTAPGRLGDLIRRYAAMSLENRMDQLRHLGEDAEERANALGVAAPPEKIQFIRTDEDARQQPATAVTASAREPDDGVGRPAMRWPAAPWLNQKLHSAEQIIALVSEVPQDQNLYDFVHGLPNLAAGPVERYTDVLGDALGQL